MVVELGSAKVLSRDFINMNIGDVIALDNDVDDEMAISVGGITKFMGVPGVVKGNKAVKLTRVIPRAGSSKVDPVMPEIEKAEQN